MLAPFGIAFDVDETAHSYPARALGPKLKRTLKMVQEPGTIHATNIRSVSGGHTLQSGADV